MRRTEVRPIPNRRAISDWFTCSALSRRTSSAFGFRFAVPGVGNFGQLTAYPVG
jgi:hypothetical protein